MNEQDRECVARLNELVDGVTVDERGAFDNLMTNQCNVNSTSVHCIHPGYSSVG